MLPFSIERLIMDMDYDFLTIEKDIIKHKFQFCVDFEKEMGLGVSEYSQSIFDYLFNMYFFKKAFDGKSFQRYLSDFKDLNFNNSSSVVDFISSKYMEFIVLYKKHFMDYFGFKHEDLRHMAKVMHDNKSTMKQKVLEYF